MSATVHIHGQYELMAFPSKLEMREDGGTIYIRHGGTTVSLTFTDEQAKNLVYLLNCVSERGGFREMEEM